MRPGNVAGISSNNLSPKFRENQTIFFLLLCLMIVGFAINYCNSSFFRGACSELGISATNPTAPTRLVVFEQKPKEPQRKSGFGSARERQHENSRILSCTPDIAVYILKPYAQREGERERAGTESMVRISSKFWAITSNYHALDEGFQPTVQPTTGWAGRPGRPHLGSLQSPNERKKERERERERSNSPMI